ncbi:MAG: hypothetical protein LKF96_06280 [Treponema sp.]|jgi:hypothetical protein|nr:hypothetical protein [Treponema sp.]
MYYVVIDKQAASKDTQYTDFNFQDVAAPKRAVWHSAENAAFALNCYLREHTCNFDAGRFDIREDN